MTRITRIALGLGVALATLATAAHADDDRFTVRLGAMHAKAESQISGTAIFEGEEYDFGSERYEIGEKTVPRIEGAFRFGQRHRLLFNYFRYDETNRATLGEDVTFDDVTIPAGSYAELGNKFDLGSLVYDFALVETPTLSFGLQIGAETARLQGRVYAEAGEDSFEARASERGTAPVVGARIATQTEDGRWRFVTQAQYLDADWGDFDDYSGDISRANALVEYRFARNVGIYAGYDWFKLDVRQSGSDGDIGLDQRFRGPTAGVTFAF